MSYRFVSHWFLKSDVPDLRAPIHVQMDLYMQREFGNTKINDRLAFILNKGVEYQAHELTTKSTDFIVVSAEFETDTISMDYKLRFGRATQLMELMNNNHVTALVLLGNFRDGEFITA